MLRWPGNVVQVALSLSSEDTSLFDAFFLSNLWEYHHEGLYRWKLDSLVADRFNQCDVICPKAAEFREIKQNNGYYAV